MTYPVFEKALFQLALAQFPLQRSSPTSNKVDKRKSRISMVNSTDHTIVPTKATKEQKSPSSPFRETSMSEEDSKLMDLLLQTYVFKYAARAPLADGDVWKFGLFVLFLLQILKSCD